LLLQHPLRQSCCRSPRWIAQWQSGRESHSCRTENQSAEYRHCRYGKGHRHGRSRRARSFKETVTDALAFGHEQIKKILDAIRELYNAVRPQKAAVAPPEFDESLARQIETKYGERLHDALDTAKYPKLESYGRIAAIEKEIKESIPEEDEDKRKLAARAFERLRERIFREDIIKKHRRPDARAFDQIRQITCEVGLLPRVHGSALFTRGETQSLATTTL